MKQSDREGASQMWSTICGVIWCGGILLLSLWWLGGADRAAILRSAISALAGGALHLILPHLPAWWCLVPTSALWLALSFPWKRPLSETLAALLLSVPAMLVLLPVGSLAEQWPTVWRYAAYAAFCLAALGASLLPGIKREKGWYARSKSGGWNIALLILAAVDALALCVIALCSPGTPREAVCAAALLLALFPAAGAGIWLATQQRQMARREQTLTDWQRESREYMNTIRSQRHDFNLHIHALTGLIDSGDYDACRDYLHRMAAEAADVNDIMPVSDAVVGSMLYLMRQEARRKGTDITYKITYDMRDILCSGFECNKIIGNLLQNAIDAAVTPEDLAYGIHMAVFRRRGNTVITVENRFTGDKSLILRAFEVGYSTKKRHEGIGLSMVQRTLEQYGGRIYPEFEGDCIRFVVNIPNRVNLDGEEEPL